MAVNLASIVQQISFGIATNPCARLWRAEYRACYPARCFCKRVREPLPNLAVSDQGGACGAAGPASAPG